MLSIKELRIGNKVSIHSGFQMDVVAIFEDTAYLNFDGNEGDVWEEKQEDLEGIKITDEIISAWWTNREDRKTDDLQLSVEIIGSDRKKHIILNDNYWIKCECLHELQNIYYVLTGKELKFKKVKN